MGALDAFYSTWSDARATFGQGVPQDGTRFNQSSKLMQMKANVEAAAPDDRWQGPASQAYAAKNTEHAERYGALAALDKNLAAEVTNAANVVDTGRQNLNLTKSWVDSMANAIPGDSSAADRDSKLLTIANEGISKIRKTVTDSTTAMTEIGERMQTLKGRYDTVAGGKPDPGDKPDDTKILGFDGDEAGNEDSAKKSEEAGDHGAEDGRALAEQAELGSAQRDPEVFDRVASHLPPTPLTEAQMQALADGKEVSDVPKETLDYYRNFYQAAGKDGLLALDRHLEAKEANGNNDAGAKRDRLANGLTITSNENVVERNPDGTIAARGGYSQLPADLREMLEVRRSDRTYPDEATLLPAEAKNRHVADVVQFSKLMGEANPGYQPGSRLGTEMYLKSADMVEYSLGGRAFTLTPPEDYERAANTLADVAGRNNQASYEIWSGQGDDLPPGYNRTDTVRTLVGHDWSQSGGEGNGAATLLDWMTADSHRPVGDPLGDRARLAMTEIPDMLAPGPDDPVYSSMRDAFAHNDAISTEMSQLLAANIDSLAAPGSPQGYAETKVDSLGNPVFGAADANRLLELGSYSEEGRVALSAAAENARIDELQKAMSGNSGSLSEQLASSAGGNLSGRIDQAMLDAVNHQNDVLQTDLEANDAVYRAKILGAELAGVATGELTGKIPGADIAADVTGIDTGEALENAIKEWVDKPEYKGLHVPEAADLEAASTRQAQQAIIEAANRAGKLPPILSPNGQPVDVAQLATRSPEFQALQQFLINRGLSQYVKDYGQSYADAVD